MKIKEQNGRIVTVPTMGDPLYGNTRFWMFLFVISIPFALFPPYIGGVIPVVLFLYILGNLIGKKIVIDKLTQSITVTKRHFMLIPEQHTIPFSEVLDVFAKYKHYGGGGPMDSDGYEVYIHTTRWGDIRIANRGSEGDALDDTMAVRRLILGGDKRCT